MRDPELAWGDRPDHPELHERMMAFDREHGITRCMSPGLMQALPTAALPPNQHAACAVCMDVLGAVDVVVLADSWRRGTTRLIFAQVHEECAHVIVDQDVQ